MKLSMKVLCATLVVVSGPAIALTPAQALAGVDAGARGLTTTLSGGQDASNCITLRNAPNAYDYARLQNNCGFEVEVAWCAQGYDCQYGLSNMQTIYPGSSYAVQGTNGESRTVSWGACRGRNTIHTTRGSMSFNCSDPL